jgi:hypothetical protein
MVIILAQYINTAKSSHGRVAKVMLDGHRTYTPVPLGHVRAVIPRSGPDLAQHCAYKISVECSVESKTHTLFHLSILQPLVQMSDVKVIAVAGASGYVGKPVVDELLKAGTFEVRILTRKSGVSIRCLK